MSARFSPPSPRRSDAGRNTASLALASPRSAPGGMTAAFRRRRHCVCGTRAPCWRATGNRRLAIEHALFLPDRRFDRGPVARPCRVRDGVAEQVPDETPVAVAAETPAPQVASGRKNQPRRPPDIKLDAGCPLGSEAVLGLNLAEKDCNAHPHTNPRGPVGIPATP